MRFTADLVVIGAGICGTAAARALSRYDCSVVVVEKGPDIASGATKANSGIVHAGYDALPGSRKAAYNVRGAAMMPALCQELSVPYRQCGALVIGFDEKDRNTLQELLTRGQRNGVPGLRLVEKEELLSLEPALNPEVLCALLVPTSAVVSPYELAFALADDAAANSVRFRFNEAVTGLRRLQDGSFLITTPENEILCKAVINCAGAASAELHNQISDTKLTMIHRRGQYYLLDRAVTPPFSRTIFQCPSVMGKGVLVSPTVHGNTLMGPNAEDIQDPLDTATTAAGLEEVLAKAVRTWPQASSRYNITNFSGVRAHLTGDDFVIGPVSGCPGAFEAAGIESPGLSSAPAIGSDLAEMVAEALSLRRKETLVPYLPPEKPFHDMTAEERAEAVRQDPAYGNIICRCEVVTEAEIRAAIRRPAGATTVDGIKRRTRAGMGRCQSGFCLPRVIAVLAEELGRSPDRICKDGPGSLLLDDTVESFLKGGMNNA